MRVVGRAKAILQTSRRVNSPLAKQRREARRRTHNRSFLLAERALSKPWQGDLTAALPPSRPLPHALLGHGRRQGCGREGEWACFKVGTTWHLLLGGDCGCCCFLFFLTLNGTQESHLISTKHTYTRTQSSSGPPTHPYTPADTHPHAHASDKLG